MRIRNYKITVNRKNAKIAAQLMGLVTSVVAIPIAVGWVGYQNYPPIQAGAPQTGFDYAGYVILLWMIGLIIIFAGFLIGKGLKEIINGLIDIEKVDE